MHKTALISALQRRLCNYNCSRDARKGVGCSSLIVSTIRRRKKNETKKKSFKQYNYIILNKIISKKRSASSAETHEEQYLIELKFNSLPQQQTPLSSCYFAK